VKGSAIGVGMACGGGDGRGGMASARLQAAAVFLVALVAAPVNASNGVQYIQPDWAQVCVILVQPRERARLSALHDLLALPPM
jgi:hypothetical protein